MTSKIRIRWGAVEVEYEGSEEFVKHELPALLAAVSRLHKETAVPSDAPDDERSSPRKTPRPQALATASIAGKLGCSSGPELILAAAARLTIYEGKQSFSRQELHDEMKKAPAYFKKTYSNNLTTYLNNLTKGKAPKFIQPATDTYAVSQTERERIEAALAT